MNHLKYKVYGVATSNITPGNLEFEYLTANNHDLMFLIICFFLKIRWMFTDQEELLELQETYNDIIERYPSSINNVSKDYLNDPKLNGETTLKFLLFKKNNIGIESFFPSDYSNSSVIDIAVVFADKIYQILNAPEKQIFLMYIKAFKKLIFNDNQNTTSEYLREIFSCVSEYRTGMYKHYKKAGIIKF